MANQIRRSIGGKEVDERGHSRGEQSSWSHFVKIHDGGHFARWACVVKVHDRGQFFMMGMCNKEPRYGAKIYHGVVVFFIDSPRAI